MQISELMEKLAVKMAKHGDIEVKIEGEEITRIEHFEAIPTEGVEEYVSISFV